MMQGCENPQTDPQSRRAPRVSYRMAEVAAALAEPGTLALFGFGAGAAASTDPRYLQVALQAFDAPAMQTNCEARASSTVATQSLMLMNGDFWPAQAGALADRAQREPSANVKLDLVAGLTPRWQSGPPTEEVGLEPFAPPDYLSGYGRPATSSLQESSR